MSNVVRTSPWYYTHYRVVAGANDFDGVNADGDSTQILISSGHSCTLFFSCARQQSTRIAAVIG